ncbi:MULTISPECIES: HPr(Ser) kinase/phosphatase [Lactobacillaceae]|uniref:HPr kinase/phosphorylase n=1 Tax=Levilactobacillus parabrevis ATCC 53295 TaxID=1267003 RepID=A0A0R1GY01_9LACO|nr:MULTISPECIES: HPr(Ser) kinase/phosphatase [Lactobacillaceae]KRK39260.1 HPr kinase phosphorylase [Levilactobacillus parabrevis ATCC 53295]KRO07148.1 HPr kinase phosphorylase [Levilactobacillus parabrevis]MCT4487264.1 HPr kinase/phosphorylase [Levilactobacillus parabrevis]MCT4490974.1 HPr kinase/phosphorylase [Levilactobacillus parabrevis]NLR09523.1 HPr kinase/phosphorylase [Lactobacillus sp. HBUAS51381]
MPESVTVADLVKANRLDVYSGEDHLDRLITTSDISRPGLELTGYFNYYPAKRIQLLGITETSFAKGMTHEKILDVMRKMCQPETPAFVISTQLDPPEELKQSAEEAGIPILGTKLTTSRVLSNMTNFLEGKLAERQSVHGVLVDIYGVGVMITGDSGVGKSETALELVKRGHRLIADDRVEVYQQDEQTLVGAAPAILSHLLEIRGIGIIDVMNLFGAGAVRAETDIDLIVHLQAWKDDNHFDRLGNNSESQKFFDVVVPKITIPVRTGRNLAIIVEAAAMNFRARSMGYDATKVFDENLNRLIKQNSQNK